MPRPIGHIRILMSSRVLLDLEEADRVFKEQGLEEYIRYMKAEGPYADDFDSGIGGRRLKKGPLFSFAQAALELNNIVGEQIVEIGVVCKDVAESALPIFRNLDMNGLGRAEFRLALGGYKIHPLDLEAFEADLFLTRNHKECQMAVDHGVAAATINFPPHDDGYEDASMPVRIWVDGDAVSFDSSAEVDFKSRPFMEALNLEQDRYDQPLGEGPFTKVLAKISQLNAGFPAGEEPFEISLLTSRGGQSAARLFTSAVEQGIHFNGRMMFMGGMPKLLALKAHKPDLFLDDQAHHLEEARAYCPTGLVAYKTGSPMYEYMKSLEEEKQGLGKAFKNGAEGRKDNEPANDSEGPEKPRGQQGMQP